MELSADNDNLIAAITDDKLWSGIHIDKLPRSKSAAVEIGCRYYFGGETCIHGHISPRYSSSGNCITCQHQKTALRRSAAGQSLTGKHAATRAHMVRSIAALDGARTYIPDRPCKSGHLLRWVGTNNCIECEEAKKAGYRAARREARLVKKYGMSADEFETMAANQNYCCLICTNLVTNSRSLHVDHCHDTGKVRGLLCSKCNQAIGLLNEDPAIIRAAARYIENAAA